MLEAFLDRTLAPGFIPLLHFPLGLHLFCECDKLFGGFVVVIVPVEDHVLTSCAQLRIDFIIHYQLTGIDDPHVHTRADGVIKEYGVHGFAYMVVPSE